VQISRAVELEVTRRLEERERQRVKEEQDVKLEKTEDEEPIKMEPQETLPSGVLTPLLKRHRDLDDELKTRLHALESQLYVQHRYA
jgi:kinesin family member 22